MNANDELLGREEVAVLCKLPKKSSVLDGLLSEPHFPTPIYLSSRRPRWFRTEVLQYLRARREEQMGEQVYWRIVNNIKQGA